MKVNLDTGRGNENELFLWSSCDLQPMNLDNGTKEEKAIKKTLLSNSIIKREVSSALPGRFWLRGVCGSSQPSRFEADQVQRSADASER